MTSPGIDRRTFLATSALFAGGLPLSTAGPSARSSDGGPIAVSSGNGLPAVGRAVEMMQGGSDPLEAVVAGVSIVEDDPNDTSVGYGGLPNERGVVELDSSVMHGPTHKAGAVAAAAQHQEPFTGGAQGLPSYRPCPDRR